MRLRERGFREADLIDLSERLNYPEDLGDGSLACWC